ncbi:MAG: hypothetical protein M3N97_09400 [Pseudomonadota bacterium]|nr:hypothetical protein [Pseudomonadota bacterium]
MFKFDGVGLACRRHGYAGHTRAGPAYADRGQPVAGRVEGATCHLCDLVEEFTRQILPRLVTRDLKHDITCVPYQQSGSRFLVKGEILRPLRPTDQASGR